MVPHVRRYVLFLATKAILIHRVEQLSPVDALVDVEAVDLHSLVRGMQPFIQRSIGPTIRVSIRVPSNLPRVRTDPSQLEAALLNLAVNARDAMPEGGALIISARKLRISRTAEAPLQPGEYVCVSVVDTGVGMDEETLAKATDPFFTTKPVGSGTGLGLSTSFAIVERHGGRILVESEVGRGTTFEIWLPIGDNGSRDDAFHEA